MILLLIMYVAFSIWHFGFYSGRLGILGAESHSESSTHLLITCVNSLNQNCVPLVQNPNFRKCQNFVLPYRIFGRSFDACFG